PPFHAYQYVRTAPSASFFVIELRPLSLTRIPALQPLVKFVVRDALTRLGDDDGNLAGRGIELDAFGTDGFASTPRARNLALGKSVRAARFLGGLPVGEALRVGFGRRHFHALMP